MNFNTLRYVVAVAKANLYDEPPHIDPKLRRVYMYPNPR